MGKNGRLPKHVGYDAVKRLIDLVVSIAALVILFPILIALAVAVAVTSPGGPLFRQERVGRDGEYFRIVKFRTMTADAPQQQAALEPLNELDGGVFAIRNDPRVTSVGRFLRRTSLDELPQLLNVFSGEMSLVGPRPLPKRDQDLLSEEDKVRNQVKPGMTGLSQISGRNSLKFNRMMELDAKYVRDRSFRLDLMILLRTPMAVLSGAGAY